MLLQDDYCKSLLTKLKTLTGFFGVPMNGTWRRLRNEINEGWSACESEAVGSGRSVLLEEPCGKDLLLVA